MARARDIEIAPVGDAAVLVRLGADVSLVTHARVMALLRALDRAPPAGLRDVVPAYTTALVIFDPLVTTVEAMEAHIRLALAAPRRQARATGGRLVRIPVWYGGESGPDLDEVARVVGLPPDEVVRRHAAAEYHVYFVGFQAGFPYLGGLPAELAVPRLPNPRAFVPAGSVGLGGQQTGVYPVTAPGGWRLIGRTPMRLFDPMADPPALLRPGDRVRFEAIQGGEAGDVTSEEGSTADQMAREHRSAREGHKEGEEAEYVPWLRVRRPGPLATVQDLGRRGCARYGVSASGAADADALLLGNALLGNPFAAAGLELTLGGGELEVMAPCMVALTGAECEVCVGGGTLKSGVVVALAAGDVLQIGSTRRGARVYLCVAGGVGVRAVLGSRSTDLRAGLGGIEGRALRAGDVLMRGAEAAAGLVAGRELGGDPVRRFPANGAWRVRVLAGPHAAQGAGDLEALLAGAYTVDLQSDRVGVRLRTVSLPSGVRMRGGDIISEGVPRGAIQVPANGEPIILLADHQTTGGYRVPAVVAGADLWRVAQMRPGDTVRFALVTRGAALAAWRARQEWLQRLAGSALGIAGAPDVGRLMRGFAEWSEEAYDEA